MKISEILKLFRVHKDIWEEHPLARSVVQVGVGHSMSFVLSKGCQVLDPLQDKLVVVVELSCLGQTPI
jgi:hypothetical protein